MTVIDFNAGEESDPDALNKHSKPSTVFKGVYERSSGAFDAQISNKKKYYLGYYTLRADAALG